MAGSRGRATKKGRNALAGSALYRCCLRPGLGWLLHGQARSVCQVPLWEDEVTHSTSCLLLCCLLYSFPNPSTLWPRSSHSLLESPLWPFFLWLPHVGHLWSIIWEMDVGTIDSTKGYSYHGCIISFWSWTMCLCPLSRLELERLGGWSGEEGEGTAWPPMLFLGRRAV